jgi:hypothetical protein
MLDLTLPLARSDAWPPLHACPAPDIDLNVHVAALQVALRRVLKQMTSLPGAKTHMLALKLKDESQDDVKLLFNSEGEKNQTRDMVKMPRLQTDWMARGLCDPFASSTPTREHTHTHTHTRARARTHTRTRTHRR